MASNLGRVGFACGVCPGAGVDSNGVPNRRFGVAGGRDGVERLRANGSVLREGVGVQGIGVNRPPGV